MEYSVEPSHSVLNDFRDEAVSNRPIVMLNLLRFRERADYQGLSIKATACSGREAYRRYSKAVAPLLLESGGAPIWMGKVRNTLIAPSDEHWDQALLVAYPSRKAFMKMISSTSYQEVMEHRTAALLDSRLIETQTSLLPKKLIKMIGWGFRTKSLMRPRD